jgi:hypothetical protein
VPRCSAVPIRTIVGEVRGADAFDLLQALNTERLGSMTLSMRFPLSRCSHDSHYSVDSGRLGCHMEASERRFAFAINMGNGAVSTICAAFVTSIAMKAVASGYPTMMSRGAWPQPHPPGKTRRPNILTQDRPGSTLRACGTAHSP